MLIPAEHLPYFERKIYLPMLHTVLEQDRATVERSDFKLHRPYIAIIDAAIKGVQADVKATNLYMRQNGLRIERGTRDEFTTEYTFYFGGYEQNRRYLNVRLRNRTEELLEVYLMKT